MVRVEKLPEQRLKFALYGRYNWFINKMLIIRTGARLYKDDWDINSFTFNSSLPVKLSKSFTLSPFYRFHVQTASKYFAGYGRHNIEDEYYTSDFDLENLESHKYGGSARYVPFHNMFYIQSLDLRFAHYERSDGLSGNSLTLQVNFEL